MPGGRRLHGRARAGWVQAARAAAGGASVPQPGAKHSSPLPPTIGVHLTSGAERHPGRRPGDWFHHGAVWRVPLRQDAGQRLVWAWMCLRRVCCAPAAQHPAAHAAAASPRRPPQICHTLCVTCQLPVDMGGGEGKALYIGEGAGQGWAAGSVRGLAMPRGGPAPAGQRPELVPSTRVPHPSTPGRRHGGHIPPAAAGADCGAVRPGEAGARAAAGWGAGLVGWLGARSSVPTTPSRLPDHPLRHPPTPALHPPLHCTRPTPPPQLRAQHAGRAGQRGLRARAQHGAPAAAAHPGGRHDGRLALRGAHRGLGHRALQVGGAAGWQAQSRSACRRPQLLLGPPLCGRTASAAAP